jgi:hypothetical protein
VLTPDEARAEIEACAAGQRNPGEVETFFGALQGASNAARVKCKDGSERAIKRASLGKHVIAEHIVGRIGQLMGAPVGDVGFVVVPPALSATQPELVAFGTTLCHSTAWIPNAGDRLTLEHANEPYNRDRFALIVVLYSLAHAEDPQVLYAATTPRLVYSVDHGHFLYGGPGSWTEQTLSTSPNPSLHRWGSQVELAASELSQARTALESVSDNDLEKIVRGPPDEWGATPSLRVALQEYFRRRRAALLAILPESGLTI